MKVKIKKLHPDAAMPTYAKPGDAAMDLTAVTYEYDRKSRLFVYFTGLSFEIPRGYVGLLFPRSSISQTRLVLSNSVGVLDSGYRGEVTFKFTPTFRNDLARSYKKGDRIGQILIIPYPKVEFEWAEALSSTERGTGGYGSSGK